MSVVAKFRLYAFFIGLLLFPITSFANYYCAWAWGMCPAQTSTPNVFQDPAAAGQHGCNYLKNSSNPPSPYYNYAGVTGPDYYGNYSVSCWPGSAEIRVFSGQPPNCSGGDLVSGSCVCPSGQTLQSGVCVAQVVQDCPSGQYRNQSNTCIAVPNCWTNNPQYEASFFDVQAGSCMEYTGPISICIGGNPKYCAPLADCQKSSDICSNNQADIDANNSRQAVVTPAKKTEATASAQTADNAKNDAVAASSAKQAASQAAQQNNQAAQSAANSNPTVEALNAAAQAATQAATAAAKAANAAASAQTTQGHAADAAAARDEITPSYPPGRAENAAESAAAAAGKAVADALKAIQGVAPDGNGSGEDMGTCPECAKESTLQSFKAGDGNSLNPGSPGEFDNALVDSEIQTAKTAYSQKVNEIKTQFSQTLDIQLNGVGQLPSFDYGTIKGFHVVNDISRFTDLINIGNIIIFIAGFLALRIILEF